MGRERTRIQTMYQWEIYKPFYGIYLYNSGSLDLFICLKKTASCHLHFTHTHIYEYQLYAYETCCIVKLITVCENQDLHKNYPNIRDSGVIFLQSFQLFDYWYFCLFLQELSPFSMQISIVILNGDFFSLPQVRFYGTFFCVYLGYNAKD